MDLNAILVLLLDRFLLLEENVLNDGKRAGPGRSSRPRRLGPPQRPVPLPRQGYGTYPLPQWNRACATGGFQLLLYAILLSCKRVVSG